MLTKHIDENNANIVVLDFCRTTSNTRYKLIFKINPMHPIAITIFHITEKCLPAADASSGTWSESARIAHAMTLIRQHLSLTCLLMLIEFVGSFAGILRQRGPDTQTSPAEPAVLLTHLQTPVPLEEINGMY